MPRDSVTFIDEGPVHRASLDLAGTATACLEIVVPRAESDHVGVTVQGPQPGEVR
jgi:hypothetical protein